MKKIEVEKAIGMTLCHDITAMRNGFKGALFKRGHVITAEDVPTLLDIGKKHVFIWEENAGEIHEEDAALRMLRAIQPEGTRYVGPSEGKIVLISEQEAMFRVNTELLRKVNSISDITIATLPDHYPVKNGSRLASMRIVPLVTQEQQIIDFEKLVEGEKLVDVLPYKHKKAGIIITGSEVYSGRIQDKFEAVARKKLSKYPCEVLGVELCDDKLEMLLDKAHKLLDMGADLLIFSGGMSVDPDDLTPSAIRELGADIISYGVPSQPGNMTLVAYLGETAILGVPGAAISLPTTVFDVVLPQVFTGLRFTKAELINLADGGLCQLCGECKFPNCTFGRY